MEKKVESLKENLEKKELQVNEILKATNLDPVALSNLAKKLEDVLNSKNDQIKDLQYELAKVSKSQKVNEAKLKQFLGADGEEGSKPLLAQ